jgi:Fe-S-cluster containining protein
MEKELFYVDGLKFSCKRCSSCCRYDQGFVYLSKKDLKNLSSALKIDEENVISEYCRWVSNWNGDAVLSLKEKSNYDCILWDSGCTVYQERPLQCVTFPFWASILADKKCWESAAESCPGMNYGQLHTMAEIEEAGELRSVEPVICKTGGSL